MQPMLRRVVALLFALAFSLPVFAAAESAGVSVAARLLQFDAGAANEASPPLQDSAPDEQPGQSPCEGAMDSPALLTVRPEAKAPLLTMSRPRPYAMAAWRAPFLDGPQRPPCAALGKA